jgi:hypothetical protein
MTLLAFMLGVLTGMVLAVGIALTVSSFADIPEPGAD